MEEAGILIKWVVVGVFLIIFAYALVRSVSFAYFRTKAEYKEMTKGDQDGV